MIPISRLKDLPDDINLNPFEIYLLISPDSSLGQSVNERVSLLWNTHPLIGEIFRVKFIDKQLLTKGENVGYYGRVLKDVEVMARVIRPADDRIRVELGHLWFNGSDEDLAEDMIAFLYQLCKTDIEEIAQVIIDMEFSAYSEKAALSLEFLNEIENAFRTLAAYLRKMMRESSFFRFRQHNPSSGLSTPRNGHNSSRRFNVNFDSDKLQELPQILHQVSGEMKPIEIKAGALGFDVMSTDTRIDPSLSISIIPPGPTTLLPRLSFRLGSITASTERGYKEGLFLYVCALVYYVNGKEFRKSVFTNFIRQLKRTIGDVPERYASIQPHEMEQSLRCDYLYFKSIYDALFRFQPHQGVAPTFAGGKSFKEWCVRLVYNERDPFNQGMSNLRRDISEAMKRVGLGYLQGKVNMKSQSRELRPYVLPRNIHFPDTSIWNELVPSQNIYQPHAASSLSE